MLGEMNAIKSIRLAGMALLLSLALTGCDNFNTNIQDLMKPPKLTEQQAEITAALEAAVGDTLTLKYPKSGDYRSAFVFQDIDADGEEEAIAFYSAASREGDTWVNILDQVDGEWRSVYEVAGSGNEVEYVDFAPITSPTAHNIVIGWNYGGVEDKSISVYSYGESGLQPLYTERYAEVVLYDVNMDGCEELLLITPNNQNRSYLRLIGQQHGKLEVTGQVFLSENVLRYEQLLLSNWAPGQTALFIDMSIGEALYTTVAVGLGADGLQPLMRDATNTYVLPTRTQRVLSMDINGDGICEVPYEVENPAVLPPSYSPAPLTAFGKVEAESVEQVATAVANLDGGYLLCYPERWVGKVAAALPSQGHEWTFYAPSAEEGEEPLRLLAITYFNQNDNQDKFQSDNYQELKKRGLITYYAALFGAAREPLALTWEELEELFILL